MAQLRLSATPPHSLFPTATKTGYAAFRSIRFLDHPPLSFPTIATPDSRRTPVGFFRKPSPPVGFRNLSVARAADDDGAGTTMGGGGGGEGGRRRGGGGGGGGGSREEGKSDPDGGLLGVFLEGWRSRVRADPQFPFKVLMEELVGVSACVIGDMASRPDFGLNELDFVFSTLVVGSILNFVLMYLLAPTAAASPSSGLFASVFSGCPKSHMFEPGPYNLIQRSGTVIYKGVVFAAVGFVAGLVGTAISNTLIALRKQMDPAFDPQNKAPPTLLNALTWATHMGVSSNLRYQTLNGIEFLLARWLPSLAFRGSVVALRCANNVLGGASFVLLARLTGSQKVEQEKEKKGEVAVMVSDDDGIGEVQKGKED
ncbi:protein RETICULATA-RELATED 3, chloroplastic-like [Nymphaea colorata]|uniref:Protein RETICULATA-RELATED 3, chloroplastic n=1 Tax=Nymphaea colorata TaxID=210225 RepID=A0A5K1GCR6_9MAGN|nr:protein RETICULATA-RELATED 3, chloroplastic-like [Nymphaea colorata]